MARGDSRSEGASTGRPAALSDHFLFMRKFFRHRRKIASIWPSSGFMARACISQVDFTSARLIVELGAGTGAITQAILGRISPQTRLLVVERDADFFRILRERFADTTDRIEFLKGDVEHLPQLMRDCGVGDGSVDAFISGLGTPSLPKAAQAGIFNAVARAGQPDAVFSNITEIPLYYLPFYRRHFQDVQFQFVPLNVPPGGIYHCRHIRTA
jgi:phospholipid N-methyltransferase